MKNIKCQFCNKFCSKGNSKYWQICHLCDVSFRLHKRKVDLIHFTSQEKDGKFYTIHLLLKENESNIYCFQRIPIGKGASLIASFDHIINITPTNLQDKLKTYLLFL